MQNFLSDIVHPLQVFPPIMLKETTPAATVSVQCSHYFMCALQFNCKKKTYQNLLELLSKVHRVGELVVKDMQGRMKNRE